MEKYEEQNSYQIVGIIRSPDELSIQPDKTVQEVKFLFAPNLILKKAEQLAIVILSSQFILNDDSPLTNELVVQVTFKFNSELPVIQDGDDKAKITNHEDLLSVFDTSIGIFRGILFEWLGESNLQHPLPLVDIKEFVKGLKVSFSK